MKRLSLARPGAATSGIMAAQAPDLKLPSAPAAILHPVRAAGEGFRGRNVKRVPCGRQDAQ